MNRSQMIWRYIIGHLHILLRIFMIWWKSFMSCTEHWKSELTRSFSIWKRGILHLSFRERFIMRSASAIRRPVPACIFSPRFRLPGIWHRSSRTHSRRIRSFRRQRWMKIPDIRFVDCIMNMVWMKKEHVFSRP